MRRARPGAVARIVAAGLAGVLLGVAPAAGQDEASPTQPVAVVDQAGTTLVEVTAAELAALQADPSVEAVVPRGRTVQADLAQSVPFVGAPGVWATGERGADRVIAVIDTGVADTFGGTLVGQACFSADANGVVGYCGPDGGETSAFDGTCFSLGVCGGDDVLDPAAGRPCALPSDPKDCAHGTAVAAVAARHDAPAGVAPDAGVYAIQVFDPTGGTADLVDILLALDHVRQLADAGLDIAAVNLSVSTSSTFVGACDASGAFGDGSQAYKAAFDQLRARRIATAVSSGNDGRTVSMGFPACVSSAVSVGASDLDDDLADFGNRGIGLDLVAPGAREGNGAIQRLVVPGGPVTSWAGTSFSAPHVAGAFALLTRTYPKASVAQLTGFLQDSGVAIADVANPGASYRRLRLGAPADTLRAQVLFVDDAPVAGAARPVVGDFDGDGRADVLGHAPGGAPDRASFGTTGWAVATRTYSVSGSYLPLAGSFRGAANGPDDILWYAPGAAADHLWSGSASRTFSSVPVTVNGTYQPHVGDFDGDGWDDVLWYAPGPAADWLWYGGSAGFTSVATSVRGTYRLVVGDVDGDGRDDLVFHGPGAATDSLWRGTATRGSFDNSSLTMAGDYTLLVGDLNGDLADDLVLYQPGTRSDAIWRGGPAVGGPGPTGGFSPLTVQVNGTYQPAVGDVDGDGRDDILWYAPGAAADHLWMGSPVGAPSTRSTTVNGTYTPLLADLDADDGDEIVWFRSSGTTSPLWWSHSP